MQDTLTSANWRDFHQRYRSTFGWLLNKGKETPVFIRDVSETTVTFQSLHGEEYFAYADKEVTFKFLPLKRRITIGGDGTVYSISRRPARQWRRGVCSDNTYIYRLSSSGPTGQRVDIATVKNIIAGQDYKLDPKGNVVKLSDQFVIVGSLLYLYEYFIGQLNAPTGEISFIDPKYKQFTQELRDVIRDNKLNYKVV
jgi:hypothetical protein